MRLLIVLYLILGLAQMALSSVIGYYTVRSWLAAGLDRRARNEQWEEGLFIAAVGIGVALLAWLAAYGLWKRWRLVRLVLIGLSCWYLAVCAFAAAVALAMLAGLTDGKVLGTDDPPGVTLLLALGFAAFPALQCWILMRKSVRESFQHRPEAKGLEPSGGIDGSEVSRQSL